MSSRAFFLWHSQAKKWFAVIKITNKKGIEVVVPDGDVCWDCGCAAEAYPLMTRVQLAEHVRSHPKRMQEFLLVVERLRNLIHYVVVPESVTTSERINLEIYIEIAFVLLSDFTIRWSTPEALGMKTVKVLSLEGGTMTGVLL